MEAGQKQEPEITVKAAKDLLVQARRAARRKDYDTAYRLASKAWVWTTDRLDGAYELQRLASVTVNRYARAGK